MPNDLTERNASILHRQKFIDNAHDDPHQEMKFGVTLIVQYSKAFDIGIYKVPLGWYAFKIDL